MAEPSETAVKYLFANSRNLCFFNMPSEAGCEVQLTQRNHKRCLGQIAHIAAESVGGPRYDQTQTEQQRQAEPNLMLLCPNHHKLIDDLQPERFDVPTLLEMKERHLSHDAEGWKPDDAFLQYVAQDMIACYVEHRPLQFAPSSSGTATGVGTAHDASVSTPASAQPESVPLQANVPTPADSLLDRTRPDARDLGVNLTEGTGADRGFNLTEGTGADAAVNVTAETRVPPGPPQVVRAQPATLRLEGVPGTITTGPPPTESISTDPPVGPQPPTYAPDHPLAQQTEARRAVLEPAISNAEGTFIPPIVRQPRIQPPPTRGGSVTNVPPEQPSENDVALTATLSGRAEASANVSPENHVREVTDTIGISDDERLRLDRAALDEGRLG